MRYLAWLAAAFSLAAQTPEIRLVRIATGVSAPTDIQTAGDGSGRLFFVQQNGIVRLFRNGQLAATPFLDITARTRGGGEQGLLGLAFPPGFDRKQYFYVNYTDRNGDTVVARYRVPAGRPDQADASSEEVILFQDQPFANHNGGPVALRTRRLPLDRTRRRRLGRRPDGTRPEPSIVAGEDAAHRCRKRRDPLTVSRQGIRSWVTRASFPRSGPPACATRGATPSTARPATCGSATSGRIAPRRSTSRRPPVPAARTTDGTALKA